MIRKFIPLILITALISTAAEVFFVGHSLVNLNMPKMLDGIANSLNQPHGYEVQIGAGASLYYNWERNLGNEQDTDGPGVYWEHLGTGKYNVLVLTEGVPLSGSIQSSNTYRYAGNFYEMAIGFNSSTRGYIYETWNNVFSRPNSGCSTAMPPPNTPDPPGCAPWWDRDGHAYTWRERIIRDLPLWTSMADSLNTYHRPAGTIPEVRVIPAGQALLLLDVEIRAGRVPGYTSINNFYNPDGIHLTETGNYFIALVQFSAIYRRSPVGATNIGFMAYTNPITVPTALAAKLQAIAWQAVCGYARSGVSCNDIPTPVDSIAPAAPRGLRLGNNP